MTISQALAAGMALGLDRLDAQLLLLHALGKPDLQRTWLLAHDRDAMPPSNMNDFMAMVQRRAGGEPVAYLTGHKEFFGLNLHVDARVLVPRPDTETLVEWALELLAPLARLSIGRTDRAEGTVIDLGTGSGAVALAIKHAQPLAHVSAVDHSADALAVALANARRLNLGVRFSQGDWLDGIQGRFNLIVSNPPYIAATDPHLAALTHEPIQALTSGPDGLDDIRRIIAQAAAHLLPGGWLLLEHGHDQATRVRQLLHNAGFGQVQSRHDMAGTERCSGGQSQ